MNRRHNFDRAFKQFRQNLQISDKHNSALTGARRSVRKYLRQHRPEELGIKFLTQGSYAYGTLNRPNRVPPQRMDLDDGAYFTAPGTDARKLFDWADNALQGLVGAYHGWRLDTNKPSCCRLIIPGNMHIDIPLYAILDEQPNNFSGHRERYESLYHEAKIPYVAPGKVRLAHRKRGWVESDPRQIINWVLDCVSEYGKQYLRVCRYFKAWRDNQWANPPLKSILIMRMVDLAFQAEAGILGDSDDDFIVMRVAGQMIDMLHNGSIADPADDSQVLNKDISPDERRDIREKLKSLHKDMELALYGNTSGGKACELMCLQFGKWFPKDPLSISGEGKVPAAVVASAVGTPTTVTAARPWAKKQ